MKKEDKNLKEDEKKSKIDFKGKRYIVIFITIYSSKTFLNKDFTLVFV